jgi:hypothetical protein
MLDGVLGGLSIAYSVPKGGARRGARSIKTRPDLGGHRSSGGCGQARTRLPSATISNPSASRLLFMHLGHSLGAAMNNDTEECLKRAAECGRQAEAARDPELKLYLMKLRCLGHKQREIALSAAWKMLNSSPNRYKLHCGPPPRKLTCECGRGIRVPTATTTRVHHASRRRCRVAARGAGAAGRAGAPHRRARRRHHHRPSGHEGLLRRVPGRATATGLERGPQCANRFSRRLGQSGQHTQIRRGASRACAGRHPGFRRIGLGAVVASDADVADRVRECRRPGRRRLRRQPRSAGGNATGFIQFEYPLTGKWPELLKQIASGMTRAARPIRCAIGRRGGEPHQPTRCRRDRARHHGLRAFPEKRYQTTSLLLRALKLRSLPMAASASPFSTTLGTSA